MRYDFFPDREADMVCWCNTLANVLTETAGHFGVPPERLAAFVLLQQEFAQAYAATANRAGRTISATARKNEARRAIEREARSLSRCLRGSKQITEVELARLGLTIEKTRTAHVKPPSVAPEVVVLGVEQNRVALALVDAERSTRRARPDNACAAVLLYAVGDHPPATRAAWMFLRRVSQTRVTVELDGGLELGARVWFCAAWVNRRDEMSPWSKPVLGRLLGGLNLGSRAARRMAGSTNETNGTGQHPQAAGQVTQAA